MAISASVPCQRSRDFRLGAERRARGRQWKRSPGRAIVCAASPGRSPSTKTARRPGEKVRRRCVGAVDGESRHRDCEPLLRAVRGAQGEDDPVAFLAEDEVARPRAVREGDDRAALAERGGRHEERERHLMLRDERLGEPETGLRRRPRTSRRRGRAPGGGRSRRDPAVAASRWRCRWRRDSRRRPLPEEDQTAPVHCAAGEAARRPRCGRRGAVALRRAGGSTGRAGR